MLGVGGVNVPLKERGEGLSPLQEGVANPRVRNGRLELKPSTTLRIVGGVGSDAMGASLGRLQFG